MPLYFVHSSERTRYASLFCAQITGLADTVIFAEHNRNYEQKFVENSEQRNFNCSTDELNIEKVNVHHVYLRVIDALT